LNGTATGGIAVDCNYDNGVLCGTCMSLYDNGKLKKGAIYENGKKVKTIKANKKKKQPKVKRKKRVHH